MWYRATSWGLTIAAMVLVALACSFGYRYVDQAESVTGSVKNTALSKPAGKTVETPTAEPKSFAPRNATACLGDCALLDFYRKNPQMKGQLPQILESVLKVKLADLLRQAMRTRSLRRQASVVRCLSRTARKNAECASLASIETR